MCEEFAERSAKPRFCARVVEVHTMISAQMMSKTDAVGRDFLRRKHHGPCHSQLSTRRDELGVRARVRVRSGSGAAILAPTVAVEAADICIIHQSCRPHHARHPAVATAVAPSLSAVSDGLVGGCIPEFDRRVLHSDGRPGDDHLAGFGGGSDHECPPVLCESPPPPPPIPPAGC